MSKLSYDEKIKLYNDKKEGLSISSLSKKYNIRKSRVTYLTKLIDVHGYDILRTTQNRTYSKDFKQEAIDRILLNNEAIWNVAIDIGLPSDSLLQSWVKNYRENGYNIVERKRGRSPTIMKKPNKPKKVETIEEENERLKKENLYLKAELEYSKKLRAVVLARRINNRRKSKCCK